MSGGFDIYALKSAYFSYLRDLQNFQFSIVNPVFWIFLFFLFAILSAKFWKPKKSFSFCVIIAIVLLGTTKFEDLTKDVFVKWGYTLDPIIIRTLAMFILMIIWGYYALVKEEF